MIIILISCFEIQAKMLLWHCIFVGWPLLSQASVEIVSVSLGGGEILSFPLFYTVSLSGACYRAHLEKAFSDKVYGGKRGRMQRLEC